MKQVLTLEDCRLFRLEAMRILFGDASASFAHPPSLILSLSIVIRQRLLRIRLGLKPLFDGAFREAVKSQKYSHVQTSLQKKASQGTISTKHRARQILQQLLKRERRYQTWLNHNISKTIIAKAVETKSFISIKDLTSIRERNNQKPRNKIERRRSNSWAFYHLTTFLEYKRIKEGVEVVAVAPAYTSKTYHCYLHIGLRSNKSFKCSNKTCG